MTTLGMSPESWRMNFLGFLGTLAGFVLAGLVGLIVILFLLPLASSITQKLFPKHLPNSAYYAATPPVAQLPNPGSEKIQPVSIQWGYAHNLITKGVIWQQ